ncbi:MAG TPA: tripartite tricarboxylate transporter TctB family protein, partial [Dongiaceae bacterium]|nr:tripartite tricarboxylate transporter TctB family protein [Dongiaceae bacterium]
MRSNPTAEPSAPARRHPRRDEADAVLWLLGAAPAIYLLGFPIGLPLHAFVFLRVKGEGWLAAAVVSAVCLAAVIAFVEILGVPLPSDPPDWMWPTDRG